MSELQSVDMTNERNCPLGLRLVRVEYRQQKTKNPATIPIRPDEVWTMESTHEELAGGRKFRTLNLM